MTGPADEPEGHLRPTSAASLWVAAILGLGVGWLLRPVMVEATGSAPFVTWAQGLALVFVAAFLAFVAWDTWQTIQVKRHRLPGNGAVNRLVLARASALVGALVAGGYAGYGITWLGDASELAEVRAVRGSLRQLLCADRDSAVPLVNAILADAGAVPRLVRHDRLDWHVHAVDDEAPLAERVLVETAMAMIDVIRADELNRLATCAADECAGLVLDLSRNRSRRYCSTACGNRAAVAAYRARQRASD